MSDEPTNGEALAGCGCLIVFASLIGIGLAIGHTLGELAYQLFQACS